MTMRSSSHTMIINNPNEMIFISHNFESSIKGTKVKIVKEGKSFEGILDGEKLYCFYDLSGPKNPTVKIKIQESVKVPKIHKAPKVYKPPKPRKTKVTIPVGFDDDKITVIRNKFSMMKISCSSDDWAIKIGMPPPDVKMFKVDIIYKGWKWKGFYDEKWHKIYLINRIGEAQKKKEYFEACPQYKYPRFSGHVRQSLPSGKKRPGARSPVRLIH